MSRIGSKQTTVSTRRESMVLFRKANSAWESGRNKQALKLFLESASLGEASAQHNVGFFYSAGIGTKKNVDKAMYWYKKAWRRQGQTDTCINIARIYASQGNHQGSLRWWKKAISRGDGEASLDLAKLYLKKKDGRSFSKARVLLKKAKKSNRLTLGSAEEIAELLKRGRLG